MKNIRMFYLIFFSLVVKFSVYLNRYVFVMHLQICNKINSNNVSIKCQAPHAIIFVNFEIVKIKKKCIITCGANK